MSGTIGGHQSSRNLSDVWLTPPWILAHLGEFDLDPCGAPPPRPWETARHSISLPRDGLADTWHGRVWLNPPYSSAAALWLRRMADHQHGTALVFARTDTAWFQDHVLSSASSLFFLRGRVRFHRQDGIQARDNGGAPSVLVSYGDMDAEILSELPLAGQYVSLVNRRKKC